METQSAELRVSEVLRLTGWSRVHVYNLINRGKIRSRRSDDPTRSYLIERDSIDEYRAQCKVGRPRHAE